MPASPIRLPRLLRLASAARSWLAALHAAIAVVPRLRPFLPSRPSFTRSLLPIRLRRPPFAVVPSPKPALSLPKGLGQAPSNHESPTPRSLWCHARHWLRRRHSGERRYPVFRPQRAPIPAKVRPAAASARPATAGIHPHHPRTPNSAKKRPAATQEFFRKNSYCARSPARCPAGAGSASLN